MTDENQIEANMAVVRNLVSTPVELLAAA